MGGPGGISAFTTALIGAASAATVAAAAWFAHRRERQQHSGTVETSQAGDLWTAAEHFRAELNERISELVAQIEKLERANTELQEMNRNLSRQVYRLTEILREHGIEATFHEHDPGGL